MVRVWDTEMALSLYYKVYKIKFKKNMYTFNFHNTHFISFNFNKITDKMLLHNK